MSGKPSPEDIKAASNYLTNLTEAVAGTGRHAGHTLHEVGRCVYCSCGLRWRGRLPTDAERRQTRRELEESEGSE